MQRKLTTPSGKKIIVIDVASNSYRFSLVKNKELKSRYGRLEWASRVTGLDSATKIDVIEKYEILGELTRDGWHPSSYFHNSLDSLVEPSFTLHVGSDRLAQQGAVDKTAFPNYVDPQVPTSNSKYSFLSFLASEGIYLENYSTADNIPFWGAKAQQEKVRGFSFDKVVILMETDIVVIPELKKGHAGNLKLVKITPDGNGVIDREETIAISASEEHLVTSVRKNSISR